MCNLILSLFFLIEYVAYICLHMEKNKRKKKPNKNTDIHANKRCCDKPLPITVLIIHTIVMWKQANADVRLCGPSSANVFTIKYNFLFVCFC